MAMNTKFVVINTISYKIKGHENSFYSLQTLLYVYLAGLYFNCTSQPNVLPSVLKINFSFVNYVVVLIWV